MKQYHKIQSVFKRDPATKHKTMLYGVFTLPEFEFLKNNPWVWTEKVDGTNIRLMWNGTSVEIGGKTDNAQIPAPLIQWLNEHIHYDNFTAAFGAEGGVCVYGEGYGGKIQKAGDTYGDPQRFVVFDVKVGDWWLRREDVEGVAAQLGLDIVPVIGVGSLVDMVSYTAKGFDSSWGPFTAEGIVARPEAELRSRRGDRLITKIKHTDFRQKL